jgi:hypothetical protein
LEIYQLHKKNEVEDDSVEIKCWRNKTCAPNVAEIARISNDLEKDFSILYILLLLLFWGGENDIKSAYLNKT